MKYGQQDGRIKWHFKMKTEGIDLSRSPGGGQVIKSCLGNPHTLHTRDPILIHSHRCCHISCVVDIVDVHLTIAAARSGY